MKICGLQKLTLLDYPGKVACAVFLGGCNFRCPWCHNYELATNVAHETMSIQELLQFLDSRKGKIEGVAITGGEPCLNPDLPDLLRQIKAMGYKVKLDTNGSRYFQLRSVINNGLVDYVAMDIKNSLYKYKITTDVKYKADLSNRDWILRSIRLLLNSDIDYEFRTTVIDELHEPEDFESIGQMIQGAKRHFLQVFTDRDSVPYRNFHAPNDTKLRQCQNIMSKYVQYAGIRGM